MKGLKKLLKCKHLIMSSLDCYWGTDFYQDFLFCPKNVGFFIEVRMEMRCRINDNTALRNDWNFIQPTLIRNDHLFFFFDLIILVIYFVQNNVNFFFHIRDHYYQFKTECIWWECISRFSFELFKHSITSNQNVSCLIFQGKKSCWLL